MENDIEQGYQSSEQKKTEWSLIAASVLIVLLTLVLSGSLALRIYKSDNIACLIGYVSAPIIYSLFIVGLFQIGKQFRNKRSRLKIFFFSMLVMFLSNCNQIIQIVLKNVN